jgi:putative nucleotidyltransferase with HDIG domain
MAEMDVSLERLLYNLNTLSELGAEITSPKDFSKVVKSSLYMVMGTFSASRGVIFRLSQDSHEMTPLASKGLAKDRLDAAIRLEGDAVAALMRHNKPLDIRGADAQAAGLAPASVHLESLGVRLVVPLVVRDELLGLLALSGKFSGEDHSPYDLRLLSVMAQHIAFSLHSHSLLVKLMHKYSENKVLYDNLRRIYYDTIYAFAAAIDAKDAYTKGHSHRVSAYCAALAREMSWSVEDVEGIRIAGLLHDIGKIAVDKSIINKASALTSLECRELNSHPVVGYEILTKIKFPWKGIQMMTRSHHEKVDGSGYPDGLKKADIPVGARIMALIDAFDAMTTDRPYRPRLTFSEVLEEVKDNFGRQFDPEVVRSFVSALRKEFAGESDPAILPLLQEHLEPAAAGRLLEDFERRIDR